MARSLSLHDESTCTEQSDSLAAGHVVVESRRYQSSQALEFMRSNVPIHSLSCHYICTSSHAHAHTLSPKLVALTHAPHSLTSTHTHINSSTDTSNPHLLCDGRLSHLLCSNLSHGHILGQCKLSPTVSLSPCSNVHRKGVYRV